MEPGSPPLRGSRSERPEWPARLRSGDAMHVEDTGTSAVTYATGYLRRSKDAVVGAVQNNLMVQFTLVCLLLTIATASSMVKLWSTEGTVI